MADAFLSLIAIRLAALLGLCVVALAFPSEPRPAATCTTEVASIVQPIDGAADAELEDMRLHD